MAYRFNPFTGTLDQVGSSASAGADNFSYNTVSSQVTVPAGQQMVVHDIDITSELVLAGDLANL